MTYIKLIYFLYNVQMLSENTLYLCVGTCNLNYVFSWFLLHKNTYFYYLRIDFNLIRQAHMQYKFFS
jgi:hypothetical protein